MSGQSTAVPICACRPDLMPHVGTYEGCYSGPGAVSSPVEVFRSQLGHGGTSCASRAEEMAPVSVWGAGRLGGMAAGCRGGAERLGSQDDTHSGEDNVMGKRRGRPRDTYRTEYT